MRIDPVYCNNQQATSFHARLSMKKSKNFSTPCLLSVVSTYSSGMASGYGFIQHGIDIIKPSFYRKEISKKVEKVDEKWSAIKKNFYIDEKTEYDKTYNGINGDIGYFQQGQTGDCWLLSGIYALSTTSWGKDIIKNSIKEDSFGNVTVLLRGTDQKKFIISKERLENAKNSSKYASGDPDVIVLELAVEEVRTAKNKTLDSGDPNEIFRYITGYDSFNNGMYHLGYHNREKYRDMINKYIKNPDKYAVEFSTETHGFAASGVEKDSSGIVWIKYINPWDSSIELKMTDSDFVKSVVSMSMLNDVTEYLRFPTAQRNI